MPHESLWAELDYADGEQEIADCLGLAKLNNKGWASRSSRQGPADATV